MHLWPVLLWFPGKIQPLNWSFIIWFTFTVHAKIIQFSPILMRHKICYHYSGRDCGHSYYCPFIKYLHILSPGHIAVSETTICHMPMHLPSFPLTRNITYTLYIAFTSCNYTNPVLSNIHKVAHPIVATQSAYSMHRLTTSNWNIVIIYQS